MALRRRYFLILFLSGICLNSQAQVINLQGKWRFHIGDNASWSSSDFDDSKWGTIHVPSAWEDEGFNGYDGFAWYRIKFDGSRLDASDLFYVNLGFIDDCDEVYLNGQFVGFSGQLPPKFKTAFNNERKYVLPKQLINFKGMNTLAVRVFDAVHGGGIVDGDIGIYAMSESGGLLVDLQGIWSFTRSRNGDKVADESQWSNIMVPGPWEQQGYYKYDGYAWYKRTFTVPEKITEAPLVLLLGKVDDFDKVYLNGQLIGSTNDHRPYGASESYSQYRVYNIPRQLLKRSGENLIEVLVYDMGNIGGIYEGVVGITTKSSYEKYLREQ